MRDGPNGVYTYTSKNKNPEEAADTYKGAWKENKKHGIGKQLYAGVGSYYGNWENGLRHGEGVMIYSNEDIYSGQWKEGKKDG